MDTTTNFVFYASWLEDTEDMSKDELLEYLQAICEYGIHGTMKPVSGYIKGCMRMVKRDIDANMQRREEAANIHREAGKKGGRPRKIENQNNQNGFSENQNNQMDLEETQKSVNVNVNVKGKCKGINKKEIILFPKKKDDANHNTSGLVADLRRHGLEDDAIQRICKECDYGRIFHPIWELLDKCRNKEINESYIMNYLNLKRV